MQPYKFLIFQQLNDLEIVIEIFLNDLYVIEYRKIFVYYCSSFANY